VIAHDAWTALLAANDPPRLFVQGRGLVRLEAITMEHSYPSISPGTLALRVGPSRRLADTQRDGI